MGHVKDSKSIEDELRRIRLIGDGEIPLRIKELLK